MSENRVLCEVFAGSRRENTYLFVRREDGLARVPEALLAGFGSPRSVLTLELYAGRPLAQANAERVLAGIAENGFYLQLPPVDERRARVGEAAEADNGDGEAC